MHTSDIHTFEILTERTYVMIVGLFIHVFHSIQRFDHSKLAKQQARKQKKKKEKENG